MAREEAPHFDAAMAVGGDLAAVVLDYGAYVQGGGATKRHRP